MFFHSRFIDAFITKRKICFVIMEQLIINIKDSSKLSFFMQLIKQLDFVEVEKAEKKKSADKYDFFSSAGLWANREVNAKEIRKQAWDRQK